MSRHSAPPAPRSIHDADRANTGSGAALRARAKARVRRRRTMSIGVTAIGVAGVLYAVAGALDAVPLPGAVAPAGSSTVLSVAPVGSTVAEGTTVSKEAFVDVLVDGWSAAALEDRHLSFAINDGAAQELRLTAVRAADLKELQATTPQVLTYAIARQLNGSPQLACSGDGCQVGDDEVAPTALLHGDAGDADLAQQLRAFGVDSGLYFARIELPNAGAAVQVMADGYEPFHLGAPVADSGEGGMPAADASNGYLRARWLLSAGLGRFFIPEPSWLGTGAERASVRPTVVGSAPQGASERLTARMPELTALNVADPVEWSSTLTDSQLTLMTSPSKGCSSGVLCVPRSLGALSSETVLSASAVSSGERRAAVAVDARTVSVNLPAPVRQSSGGVLPAGPVTLRFVTVGLFDGSDLTLVDVAGSVGTEDEQQYDAGQILSATTLDGVTWSLG